MRIELRYAGLSEQSEQRLRLACKLMDAHQVRPSISPWDGTRCDVLVAATQDAYGQRAMEIAKRRGTLILAFGPDTPAQTPGISFVDEDSPVLKIVQELMALLQTQTASGVGANAFGAWGLCRLAMDASLQGQDIQATLGKSTIYLLPSTGRVVAPSRSELVIASENLGKSGWFFSPREGQAVGSMSLSLDSFYMTAALKAQAELPAFPDGHYQLEDWPDLGGASELIHALRVAQHLIKQPLSPEALVSLCHIALGEVSACFWAYQASGLLRKSEGAAPLPPSATTAVGQPNKPSGGLFEKLAARFGLR